MPLDLKDFKIVRECRGSPANKIYLVEEKATGQLLILKLVKVQDLQKQLREIEVHKRLSHKFVIKLLAADVQKNCIVLLVEYARFGDLFSVLHTLPDLPERRLLKFYYQLLQAVDYLHANGFLHRDIKPENILITRKFSPRLADFGTSTRVEFVQNTFCGTYEYMAPEIYLRERQTAKADVWSLGVLLYEMTHQSTPFKNQAVGAIKRILQDGRIRYKTNLNPLIRNLIARILKFSPTDRPTTAEILADPLFADFHKLPSFHDDNHVKLKSTYFQCESVQIFSRPKAAIPKKAIGAPILIFSNNGGKKESLSRVNSSNANEKTLRRTLTHEDDQSTTKSSSFKQTTYKQFHSGTKVFPKHDLFVSTDRFMESNNTQDPISLSLLRNEMFEPQFLGQGTYPMALVSPSKGMPSKKSATFETLDPLLSKSSKPDRLEMSSKSKTSKLEGYRFNHAEQLEFRTEPRPVEPKPTNLLQNLLAKVGKGKTPHSSSKNCDADLTLNFPDKSGGAQNSHLYQPKKSPQSAAFFNDEVGSLRNISSKTFETQVPKRIPAKTNLAPATNLISRPQ